MLFPLSDCDTDEEVRRDDRAARLKQRDHWCSTCLGHTGPGSPCEPEPETIEEDDDE